MGGWHGEGDKGKEAELKLQANGGFLKPLSNHIARKSGSSVVFAVVIRVLGVGVLVLEYFEKVGGRWCLGIRVAQSDLDFSNRLGEQSGTAG